jgi:hypothetical protein
MKYSLLANGTTHNNGVGMLLIGLGIIGLGAFLILIPAKHILLTDRRTGYSLYRRELERSGDEKKAASAAGIFYRVLGIIVVGFGMLWLVVGLIDFFSGSGP